MAEQKNPPPNAVKGGVIAYLSLDGAIKAGDFYKKAFAAEEVFVQPPDEKGRTMHLHLYINGSSVMMSDPYPEHGHPYVPAAGFSLMLPVKDVDAWWQRAVDAGCAPTMKPDDMFWGDRYAQAKDPFGILLGIRWTQEELTLDDGDTHAQGWRMSIYVGSVATGHRTGKPIQWIDLSNGRVELRRDAGTAT